MILLNKEIATPELTDEQKKLVEQIVGSMPTKEEVEEASALAKASLMDVSKHLLVRYAFYNEILLNCAWKLSFQVPTAGVNVTRTGMNFYYNPFFINKLPAMQQRFLVMHEVFHLLFDHPMRTKNFVNVDFQLANIAQDMIINTLIVRHFVKSNPEWIEIIKDEQGRNSGCFIPKEYEGEEVFEHLYDWLKNRQDERKQQQQQQKNNNGSNGNQQKGPGDNGKEQNKDANGPGDKQEGQNGKKVQDPNGKPDYGNYGKDGTDCYSVDSLLDSMEKNEGQFTDAHIADDIAPEIRREIVNEVINNAKARGLNAGNLEDVLTGLRKTKKNYLREIRSAVSELKGSIKKSTWVRPNRRFQFGRKGKVKFGKKLTVLLDTSGSMHGYFDKVLSTIFQNGIIIDLIKCDAQIQGIENLKSKNDVKKIKIQGLGGTELQPGVDYAIEHFPKQPMVILTDGLCDELDLKNAPVRTLILSVDKPVKTHNGFAVKNVIIDEDW